MQRTIVIFGASGGIGRVLYAQYKKQGYRLVGTCRTNSHNASLTHVDITDAAEVESFAHQLRTTGPISVINCVGVNYNSVIEKSQWWKWTDVIEVNLIGAYNLLKAFTPIMKEKGHGRFMFMSSVVVKGMYGTSAYTASKAGLEGLVKCAAKELLGYNITVNAIRLGYFNTGLIKDVPKRVLEKEVYSSTVGQLCDPTNLYGLIEGVFKCEDMTGSIINVDRGV